MQLNRLPGSYAVCKLKPTYEVPEWARGSGFLTFSVDEMESTVVCLQDEVPDDVIAEKNWAGFQVDGILDFSLTGIISSLTSILAEAKISVYVVSTYSSDYLLVSQASVDNAVDAWQSHGHSIKNSSRQTAP